MMIRMDPEISLIVFQGKGIRRLWHNEEWWPTAPYKQNFVPFPKKDIIGEILEITIE